MLSRIPAAVHAREEDTAQRQAATAQEIALRRKAWPGLCRNASQQERGYRTPGRSRGGMDGPLQICQLDFLLNTEAQAELPISARGSRN